MNPTLTVIGPGRVGKTFARLLYRTGLITLDQVVARTLDSARAATTFIGAGVATDLQQPIRPTTLFLLAVPDDQIAVACAHVVAQGAIQRGCVVFHCSGARDASELQAAADAGALVASVHPIRSFADPAAVAASFAGTFCGVEGDPEAIARLLPLLHAIGARTLPLNATSKPLYHAAAVFASNYLVTLMAVARDSYIAAGIPAELALALAEPLARETLDNVFRLGPAAALTGPIARGDEATVSRHLDTLSQADPHSAALYQAMAVLTRRLTASRESSLPVTVMPPTSTPALP
ncbi:MAG: DUF2520 domain-containing protein [Pseudomonadota bacterium]|nr:DUF2520 domain-containing protein [Pseudomonadota bacterium]